MRFLRPGQVHVGCNVCGAEGVGRRIAYLRHRPECSEADGRNGTAGDGEAESVPNDSSPIRGTSGKAS